MAVLEINGKRVEVDDSFLSLTPEQQQATVEEIAASMSAGGDGSGAVNNDGFMEQVNAGLSGIVDVMNPGRWQKALDDVFLNEEQQAVADTALLAPLRQPAAVGMNRIGIPTATEDPTTVTGATGRGLGNAAAMLVPGASMANNLRQGSGMAANIADDVWRGLKTAPGIMAELFGGASSEGVAQLAKEGGAPPWLQTTLGMAAPAAAIGGTYGALKGLKGADNVIKRMPGMIGGARRAVGNTASSLIPMTKAGATGVAANHMQKLLGGLSRSRDIAERIGDTDIGLTPAQQTGEPDLLALERAAMNENPQLRDTIMDRQARSRDTAADILADMGGNVRDAQQFFGMRLQKFRSDIDQRVADELRLSEEALDAAARHGPESEASQNAVRALNDELELVQRPREDELWNAIPLDSVKSPSNARAVAKKWETELGAEGAQNIPGDVKQFVLGNGWGDEVTARQLKVVYSNLRETARNAYAGTQQQSTLGKVANEVADAILIDMGSGNAMDEVGRTWDTARAFSKALHEKFDQGAVGKILQTTTAGDTRIPSEAALKKTIGLGGVEALAAYRKLAAASPDTIPPIEDYLRGTFATVARDAEGNITLSKANEWIRKNDELLNELPGLKSEFRSAIGSRSGAAAFALRAEARKELMDAGPLSQFANDPTTKAALRIFESDDPARVARHIARSARTMDDTGAALAGVKGSVIDYLMSKSMASNTLSGVQLRLVMEDPKMSAALREVFDAGEIGRLRKVATEMAKLELAEKSGALPAVIDTEANQILDMLLGFKAASFGAQAAGSSGIGGGIRGAGIAAGRAKKLLRDVTNRRARNIIQDAILDEDLFKALLSDIGKIPPSARNKLAPYFVGIASATSEDIPAGFMDVLQGNDKDRSSIFDFMGAN